MPAMKNLPAKHIGEKLKTDLEHLKALHKEARAKSDPDTEAIEFAIVNLSAAIEILTE